MSAPDARPTACILCSLNCGLTVTVRDGHLGAIRGDPAHPVSRGYLCQKAGRLDHYQNHADRLRTPLERQPDGSFRPVSWDQAIGAIAARLGALRDRHGGHALAYYGGGGQGNHLGGIYAGALRAAMGTEYLYSALAQEKTGDFWVNGKLFGRQTCHLTEGLEECDLALFVGTNPWQAHGIPRARALLKELAADPRRTLVVVDPRRTETAALARLHLRPRPGTDAFWMAAVLALLVRRGLPDPGFHARRTRGLEEVTAALAAVDPAAYAARAGLALADLEELARLLATARAASVRVDLGLQQSPHSTLNSWLEKLLFLLPGHFGRPGTNAFHTFLLPLIGHSDEAAPLRTRVTGTPEIAKLFPPNVLPAEIDTDHPERIRGLVVDSANPLVSGADTAAYEAAFGKLELLVVIDVAMTETARAAHYVLPAASQYEKPEATFFTLGFPSNAFHLRAPVLPPLAGTLPEPEIYRRLVVAMGALPERFPLLAWVARLDRRFPALGLYPAALGAALALRPAWRPHAALILMETLGKALADGPAAAAPLWFAAHRYAQRHADAVRRAGIPGTGRALGEALFAGILASPSGLTMSVHEHADTWGFVRHPDGRIRLDVPEMLEALRALGRELAAPASDPDFPFTLIAGERRSFNANTIYRDPAWRRADPEGALRIHPEDAARLGLADGDRARCESRRGAVEVTIETTESVLPGMVTLPHGYGLEHPGEGGVRSEAGPRINRLTDAAWCDPIARTPFHKAVPVRVVRSG